MFFRVGNGKVSKSSAFWRLKVGTQPKPSVFTKIKSGKELTSLSSIQEKGSVFGHLGEINEVQSTIPSRMKHLLTLDVYIDGSLRVTMYIVVFTSHSANLSPNKEVKQVEHSSSSHIIAQEDNARILK